MLSLRIRRSDREFERSRGNTPLAKIESGLADGRAALAALGAQLAGGLEAVGRAWDTRLLSRAGAALAGWLILGGVLVVPVAAIGAGIGALLPSGAVVHRHAGDFFSFAITWFVAALVAAQFQRRRHGESFAESYAEPVAE